MILSYKNDLVSGEKYDVAAAGAEWRREEVEVVGFLRTPKSS